MLRQRRRYSGALRCEIIALGILLVLSSLYFAFEASYVRQSQIYTQEVATGFSYTALAVSDVPFYNSAGHPPIEVQRPALYSFDYYVFATSNLRPFVFVYTLTAVNAAVLIPLDTLGALLYQPLVALMMLVELAKAVYFSLYAFDLFGLECVEHPFCRDRNPATPEEVDSRFWVALASALWFFLVNIFLLRLPGIVRRARLASDPIGTKLSDDEEASVGFGNEYGIGKKSRRRIAPKPKPKQMLNKRDMAAREALDSVPLMEL